MTDTLTREPQALPPFPLMTLGDVVKLAVQCGATESATETRLDAHAMLKFARALAAASAPGVPAGWKLVPVEATPEMIAHSTCFSSAPS